MTALEELIDYIASFTPEQLKQFLSHPVTADILGDSRNKKSL